MLTLLSTCRGILLCAFVLLTTCARGQEQPNIVWITSEDNSMHYMRLFDEHGTTTPNIEALAAHGLTYTHAFSNAAVCSAARSTLISGVYGPRMATHYHRHLEKVNMPEGLEMFPYYLHKAGYYTANHPKEDYNIFKGDEVWDASGGLADYHNRAEGQPFFYVHNIVTTHESRLHFKEEVMSKLPLPESADVFVQPKHPDTELFRYTNAYYRMKIRQMDKQLGAVVKQLEDEGLMDNTFIFYFGDHGGVLPGSKGYIYETGLHVPLVIYVPEKFRHLAPRIGSRPEAFVSFVDFAPTVLALAGVELPEGLDGKAFLGNDVDLEEVEDREETYSYADRFDEKYDMLRAVRQGKYKYLRSYQPFLPDGAQNAYRYKQLAFAEWRDLHLEGKLDPVQDAFYQSRPVELLFDVEADPYETKNLVKDPAMSEQLLEMRTLLSEWQSDYADLSFIPEFALQQEAFPNTAVYGENQKRALKRLRKIADYALRPFADVENKLSRALGSKDPWERYRALQVALTFGEEALSLCEQIHLMVTEDSEAVNRADAFAFLAMFKASLPSDLIHESLYASERAAEALQIMNTMSWLKEKGMLTPHIQEERIKADLLELKVLRIRMANLNAKNIL